MMALYPDKSPQRDKNCERHHEMYKSPPIAGCWKETYRQRCKDRLKKSRDKFLSNFRDMQITEQSVVSDLMEEEWSNLREEYADVTAEESDEIMKEIRQELQAEMFMQECEELQANYYNGAKVVCPICKMNFLEMHQNNIVWCQCGVCLHTEVGITLDKLYEFIMTAVQVHDESCRSAPTFVLSGVTMATNLLLTCQDCDLMYAVV